MKVGLFINTQFPEGLNLPERVPDAAQVRAARATPVSRLSGSRITGCPPDVDAADHASDGL